MKQEPPQFANLPDPLAGRPYSGEELVSRRAQWARERLRRLGRRAPLKVLIVSNTLGCGGAERQIVRLMPHLAKMGLAVEHLYYAEPHFLRSEIESKGLRTTFMDRRRLGQFRFWLDGCAFIRRSRFDVVHAFSESANVYGRGLAALAGTRVVLAGWRSREMWRLAAPIMSLFNLVSSGWIINSRSNVDALQGLWGMRSQRLYVVPNALDAAGQGEGKAVSLPPELVQWARGRAIVGIVGRIAPPKNYDLFLDVAALLAARRRDVCFCIVGGTQDNDECRQLEQRLRNRVASEHLEDAVRFLGRVDNVAGLLPHLTILLCTSHSEGCPNCVIEGMRAELPVVMTDCTDTELLIEEGVSGHVVPLGDARAMADRVIELLDAPERRRRFGQRARELVEQHFEAANSAWRMARIYVHEWELARIRRSAGRRRRPQGGLSE